MLEKLNITDFDELFSIMEESFPPDERRPRKEQKALFENKEYSVYLKKEDGRIKGFVAVWEFDEFLYVEHFAVAKEFRNSGTGSKMLEELKKITSKLVCLEVEPPQDEITKRRIGFYERNGFFLNEYHYIQPPISNGKKEVQLLIMTSGNKICKEMFAKIKETLYIKVYKCEK